MEIYDNLVEQAKSDNISYQAEVKRMMEYYQRIINKENDEH
jgi:hypothetical protein